MSVHYEKLFVCNAWVNTGKCVMKFMLIKINKYICNNNKNIYAKCKEQG